MKLVVLRIVVYSFLALNTFQLHESPSKSTGASMALSVFSVIVVEMTAVREKLLQGKALYLAGDYEGAIAFLSKKVLRCQPGNIEALVWRAYARSALGNYAAALQDCSQAIEIRPDYAEAYACRAKVQLEGAGEREGAIPLDACDAIADLEKSLQLCNSRTSAVFRDGVVMELERLRSAGEPTIE